MVLSPLDYRTLITVRMGLASVASDVADELGIGGPRLTVLPPPPADYML